ncbi:MAG: TetR/AcrR family transcriptional regulator [Alphaproteobacteria bacterium]|nr:TetR/AcrR family transcriptional regulator [Alphaproteobacteria bacterium]
MRVKTDERRSAILEAAAQVFREEGYDRASMSMIAERVRGSKMTLYSYFPSKEELFWAAMVDAVSAQRGEKVLAILDSSEPDVAKVLRDFGEAYLRLFTARAAIAITRTAVSEGAANKALSSLLYNRGPKRVLDALTCYLAQLQKKGLVCELDPLIGAVQLKGLFDAGIVEPLLFGTRPELNQARAVEAAVSTFLRAYDSA